MSLNQLPPTPFGVRLRAAMDEFGPLCVGIDPHPGLLEAWGLEDTAAGLQQFSMTVVEALGGRVAAFKPQSALFERHGSVGVKVLEDVLAASAAAGTLTIVDAKRGDIGSTMAGYADAYLRDGSPLAGDALTVSPYLGFGSLDPAIELARQTGRGLFVLCLTSNPQGRTVQHARDEHGVSVAGQMARESAKHNAAAGQRGELGDIGLVVGATIGGAARDLDVDLAAVNGAFLAPGVGAQGAGPAQLLEVFGTARHNVLASSSRGVLQAGPDKAGLLTAALHAAQDVKLALQ
ncbi:orotidine-5'-phosphate decarboxylase [Jonesiaceae bacterium BS-20]|uniref:Orotidine-5'-phosphate decarboxylase n=1 Tax=Jonesiaceae bacterium BS-20 TaxID=3120821 RepID=A0AAU7E019_9MICO